MDNVRRYCPLPVPLVHGGSKWEDVAIAMPTFIEKKRKKLQRQ